MYKKVFQSHAQLLQVLANPKRLEILQLLRGHNLRVGEMSQMLALPQANLSQHLMVLRRLGVVATERRGKEIYYHIAHNNFIKAVDLMRQVLFKRLGNKVVQSTEQLTVVTDPVCGMRLTPVSAARSLKQIGKVFYFCGAGCEREFINKK